MLFNSDKEINSLKKEINRLLSKFLGLKNLSPGHIFGNSSSPFQLKNQKPGSKTVWLFYYCNFERNYDVLESNNSPCILLNKNINLIKTKRNRKWKMPHTHSIR